MAQMSQADPQMPAPTAASTRSIRASGIGYPGTGFLELDFREELVGLRKEARQTFLDLVVEEVRCAR
jgi:predicted nucleic acid-binding Zn ribbon protein